MKLQQGKVYKIINSFLYCYQTNKIGDYYKDRKNSKDLDKGDSFIFLGLETPNLLKLLHKGKVIYFPFMTEEDFPKWFEELNDDNG